jgi:hypothetical protein
MSKVHAGTAEIEKKTGSTGAAALATARSRRSMLAREGVVRVAVGGSILLVLGMMALLWQHWSRTREPTTAILIHGDPSLDGARVTVESADEPSDPKVSVTLGQERKFDQPIFRYPGQYKVTVRYLDGNAVTYVVTLDHRRGAIIDLPTTVTVGAQPGDKVTLTGSDGASQSATFDSKNSHAAFQLMPGRYTLERTRGAAPLPPQDLTVEPHIPQQIDLPRME